MNDAQGSWSSRLAGAGEGTDLPPGHAIVRLSQTRMMSGAGGSDIHGGRSPKAAGKPYA